MSEKALLVILDGWGNGSDRTASAIMTANTPFMDYLMATFPNSQLTTHSAAVGLPDGQMGNSEVGHLNIGAGHIVYQELVRINNKIQDGSFQKNETLQGALQYAADQQKHVHLIGLVSDGGVHSHLNHLLALTDMCNTFPIQAYVHAFLDGRDTDPKSGFGYLETLLNNIEGSNTHLATIVGRYYAMDRDNRWERTKIAYDLLVHGIGETTSDPLKTLQERYELNETDEFVMPISINNEGKINDGDVVVFFNFRTDRPRQLTQVLSQTPNDQYNMQPKLIKMVTMTEYDASFKNIDIVFHQDILKNTLGEVVTQLGLSQVRIAETEKYPHVTYFFSGGREQPFEGEERIMIPSPKVATYDLQPEMSAYKVKEAICDKIDADQPDFICLNFANADMVGHTGVFSAAVKAVEVVDECLNEVVLMARSHGYEVIIIADHGNADYMVNSDGSPNTAHTKNPVPCIYVGAHVDSVRIIDGILADIAPTLAGLMEIDTPDEMTGKNLIQSRVQ